MQLQELKKNFSVAILMENLHDAKELSENLRELGLYAHFYSELDEFWLSANAETPDFAIVDVSKMSQGSLQFKDHPKVVNNQMAYAFFYQEENMPLLNSTYTMPHYGYIKKEINQAGQLKSMLLRRQLEIELMENNRELESRAHRMSKRSQQISEGAEEFFKFEQDIQKLNQLIEKVGTFGKNDHFTERLASVFSSWEFCKRFSIFELNQTGQKIVSPQLSVPKYKSLPSMWLGKVCSNGIELFAEEMAGEICIDEFESKNLKIIKIKGASTNPDILLMGEFKLSEIKHFPWQMLERELSGAYRASLLTRVDHRVEGDQFLPFWDALSELDDIHFHQINSKSKVFSLNFRKLMQVVSEKHANRFYFKAFFTDFLCELAGVVSESKISVTSVSDVMVFLNINGLEKNLQTLKKFVAEFSYWRYFEDGSVVMTQNMFPEIKMVAPSSVNYLRNSMNANMKDAEEVTESLARKWRARPLEAQ